MRKKTWR